MNISQYDAQPPLEVLGTEAVFKEHGGADFTVTRANVRNRHDGTLFSLHYASVKHGIPGAVCVVEHAGRLLLARHWRASIESWEWEFPRGMGKSGETPEQTAIRELQEETAITASVGQTHCLQHIHADAGVLKDDIAIVHITVPHGTFSENGNEDDWELASLTWFTFEEIDAMIANGDIIDGVTLAAYIVWHAAKRSTYHCPRD